MRKATFILLEDKNKQQIDFDRSLTGQERINRMFELIDALMKLQKPNTSILQKENTIVLKRTHGGLSQRS